MKAFVIATIIPICIGIGNFAIAGDMEKQSDILSNDKDFSVSFGVKSWFNQWDLPFVLNERTVISDSSDIKSTLIPVLQVYYKNFFVSGSFFPKTDYSFGDQSIATLFPLSNQDKVILNDLGMVVGFSDESGVVVQIPVHASISTERSEWDINVGYHLHRSLAVAVGYKRIERQVSLRAKADDLPITVFDQAGQALGTTIIGADDINAALNSEVENKTDGLILSIASAFPLKDRFGVYANFTFGWLKTKNKTKNDDEEVGGDYDSKYQLGELGFLYSHQFDSVPALNSASVYLGYRFQFLNDSDVVDGNDAMDSTEGFTLGVNIAF